MVKQAVKGVLKHIPLPTLQAKTLKSVRQTNNIIFAISNQPRDNQ
jgi:hypothetical protein